MLNGPHRGPFPFLSVLTELHYNSSRDMGL
jgi:hypothetical protein